jgi:hypothetical protein
VLAVAPSSARPPSSPKYSIATLDVPQVLSAGFDGLRLLGRCIAARASVSLALEHGSALRRVLLRDGDFVTCASGASDESLVGWLVATGELARDAGARLGPRLPPFGRHAAAALIAHGHLGQDQLWHVLRGHAEWLLGRVAMLRSGTCTVEPEAPGRLKAEPAVFGGATGAEVLVEVARRILSPEEAVQRVGGLRARLGEGSRKVLLSECALGEHPSSVVANAPGRTVADLLEELGEEDFAPVLAAVVELGVLESLPALRDDVDLSGGATGDQLDAEAVRRRVVARLAIVHEGDYFEVLGVSRAATNYEIRRAYLEMRRAFEPSRLLTVATADLADDVQTIVDAIEEAYDAIRDADRRERYRRAVEARPPLVDSAGSGR